MDKRSNNMGSKILETKSLGLGSNLAHEICVLTIRDVISPAFGGIPAFSTKKVNQRESCESVEKIGGRLC